VQHFHLRTPLLSSTAAKVPAGDGWIGPR
jgi:hypothetical protein